MPRLPAALALLLALLVVLTACQHDGVQGRPGPAPAPSASVDQCSLPVEQRTGGWFCYGSGPVSSSAAAPQQDDLMSYRAGDTDDDGRFQTPSGNIRCVFASSDDSDWVTCDVVHHTWTARSCPAGQVATVFLDTASRRRPRQDCGAPSGTGFRALGYGHALHDMTVTCTSRRDGLECRSGVTRHGFVVSSTRFRSF